MLSNEERDYIELLDRAIINHYQSRPCFICHFAIIYLRMTYPSCLRFETKTIARRERENSYSSPNSIVLVLPSSACPLSLSRVQSTDGRTHGGGGHCGVHEYTMGT